MERMKQAFQKRGCHRAVLFQIRLLVLSLFAITETKTMSFEQSACHDRNLADANVKGTFQYFD